ncbi:MAG: hypothetical protein M9958_00910 [Chitinophagales bacterium]|nr:hypothetical protein [Chitinophagales bacterium]
MIESGEWDASTHLTPASYESVVLGFQSVPYGTVVYQSLQQRMFECLTDHYWGYFLLPSLLLIVF